MCSSPSGESVFLRPFLWFSTCSAIAVLLNPISVQCAPAESIAKRSSGSADNSEVIDYLEQFGYLTKPSSDFSNSLVSGDGDAVENAIKSFQRFVSLPITGKIDEKTSTLLKSPRCGLPDIQSSSDSQRWKRSLPKSDISWSVLSHSHGKLPARIELVRHQLQKAFSVWERHAKLRFSEKDYGVRNADIAISFVNRQHGDGYPFDGPGTVLAHAFSLLHSTRAEGIDGDIHFDGDEDWRFDERETKGYSFFAVAVHELGHSLGLTHVENRQSIMFPFYQRLESNFELHPYDRWLIQNIFGPPDRHRDPPNRNPTYPEHSSPRIPMPPNAGGGHPNPHYPRYPIFPNDEGRKNPDIPSYTKHQYSPSSPSTPGYPRSNPSANPPRSAPSVPAPKKPQTDEPNECNTNYDAISVIRGELFIFKGKYFWRIRDTKNLKSHSGPNLITRMWTKLPKDLTRVDAVFQRSSDVNKIVFFIGELMYQFDGLDLDPHYPKPLTSLRIDRSVDHIDAALVWGSNNRTYLFSGRYYWKLTEDEKSIEPDYPKDIKAWDGIGDNIDAAFQWTDGITYFFKGKGFWKFDDQRMKTRNQSPIPSAQVWMGCDKSSRYHVPDKFLTDRDPGLDTLSDTNVIPHSHEAHKNPSTPSPFGVSKLVISCVAVIVMLLLVTVVAVVAQRRRRKHSYQQPKWLKVNKKILM